MLEEKVIIKKHEMSNLNHFVTVESLLSLSFSAPTYQVLFIHGGYSFILVYIDD